jgi:adenine/guanine/hypoxanthine permease
VHALLERRFRFAHNGTTLRRDSIAGATTFIVMSYIIFVNPTVLSFLGVKGLEHKGLPFNGVLASTCLIAGVMTMAMGLYTNRAYAMAPGLGLNAVVAFSLVVGAGLSFPQAMGIIVMEGIAVTALVVTGLRQRIMAAIPLELKKAIAIGIGLFIAFIGFFNSGLVAKAPAPGVPVELGSFTTWPVFVTIFGLVLTLTLRAIGFPGDLLVGIVATTALATVINWATDYRAFTTPGVARLPDHVVEHPDFSLLGNFNFGSFAEIGVLSTLVWVFSLFLSDFFDTMGTLIGVGKQAGYLNARGELPQIRKPLLVDSLGAVGGGVVSSSSATTYIESAAGIGVGGRTGWVSVVAGALFFPFLFLAPVIGIVPAQATAPALIVVGWLMMSTLTESQDEAEPGRRTLKLAGIDFGDLAVGLSAALTIMVIPFTWSITNGIGFGFVAYVVIRVAQRRWREVHPLLYVIAAAFVLYFLVPLLQQHFSFI